MGVRGRGVRQAGMGTWATGKAAGREGREELGCGTGMWRGVPTKAQAREGSGWARDEARTVRSLVLIGVVGMWIVREKDERSGSSATLGCGLCGWSQFLTRVW